MTASYGNVFFESVWTASIIPGASEPTLYAMKAFGGYNLYQAVALAIAGALAGQAFNWLTGHVLYRLKQRGSFNVSEQWYTWSQNHFYRYGIWLLFFCWAPLCNIFVVIAAFLHIPKRWAFPLILSGVLFNYGQLLV